MTLRDGPIAHRSGQAGFCLRQGEPADVAALLKIERTVFELEQLTKRSFQRYIGLASADLIVALSANTVVGYGLASFRQGSWRGSIVSIAVMTHAVGRGIGFAILTELQRLARARKAAALRLEVRRDNLAGLSLYHRAGFRKIGEKSSYYADFCDAIILELALVPDTDITTD